MLTTTPIVIVGGGPVGLVLALLLAKQGKKVTVLETRTEGASAQDNRALALSFGSRQILVHLGVWVSLEAAATAIHTIHVSQKGSIGRTLLHAKDYAQPALGYVLSYGALSVILENAIKQHDSVNVIHNATATHIQYDEQQAEVAFNHQAQSHTLTTPMLVLADGGRSVEDLAGLTRETKDYGHHALVTKVKATMPHHHVAYERFVPTGPLALLPNGAHDFSLVWTGKTAQIEALLALPDADFLTAFHATFGDRVGAFLQVDKRIAFPLKRSHLVDKDTPHMAVIGNAAQTMHPVAGQGFNVGLRDAESLAKHMLAADAQSLGSVAMLAAYQKSRVKDTQGGLKFTDFLVNIFSNELLGVSTMRGAGLGMLALLPTAKKYLVRKMSFGK